jgi:hypothetical protein
MPASRWLIVPLAAAMAISASAETIHLPDPRTGAINGHVATLVWPAREATRELLPAEGCTGHFVPLDDLNTEEVHRCGEWIQPATGRYKVWLQGADYISPNPTILVYQRDFPGERGLMAVLSVVPAGHVVTSPGFVMPPGHGLRLLALGTTSLRRAFDRRVARPQEPTLMPIGKTVAGVFDGKSGDAIAISPPFDVASAKTVAVAPKPPVSGSDVLVILERPRLVTPEQRDEVKLMLAGASAPRPPDVAVDSAERVYAIWYGVTGPSAQLTAESQTLSLAPTTVPLQPKRVSTLRSRMSLLPKLAVTVIGPPDAFKKLAIEVRRAADPTVLLHTEVQPGRRMDLPASPTDRLRVTLTADDWRFDQDADLRDGHDRDVVFTLEPLVIRGTVYWGRDPAPAEVGFQIGDDKWVTAKAGEDGAYEATLWETGQYTTTIRLTFTCRRRASRHTCTMRTRARPSPARGSLIRASSRIRTARLKRWCRVLPLTLGEPQSCRRSGREKRRSSPALSAIPIPIRR